MTDDQSQTTAAEDQPEETTSSEQETQKQSDAKYTDQDVNKLKGSARIEGRNSGRTEREQEILQATGAESVDEVLEAYTAWKTIEEESKGEAEKYQQEAQKVAKERDTVKEELEAAYAFIAEMKQEQAIKEALSDAGANPKRLKATMKFIDMDSLEVNDDGEVTGVEEAVKAAKKEFPEGFEDSRPSGSKASPKPADGPTTQQIDKEAAEMERSRVGASL